MVEFRNSFDKAGRLTGTAIAIGFNQAKRMMNDKVIRLAVTGLSRSGKTVFITSLIQNLVALGNGKNSLPDLVSCLDENGDTRLIKIHVVPAGDEVIPWFDFPAKLELLSSDSPVWPQPTDDLATISLTLEFRHKTTKFLGNKLMGLAREKFSGLAHVKLEILDYPGEWLLDLPLLDLSFQEWSRRTLEMMRLEPRAQCFADFNKYVVDRIGIEGDMDEVLVRRAHQLFKKGLMECRETYGLQYLQPGRFICPGPKGSDLPFLWFFPMEVGDAVPKSGSVAEQLVRRFEKYKDYVKAEFVKPYFSKFDRQIMLVDVLTALYKGRVAFDDTKRAIDDIATALASQKIKKLAVVATKADHVPPFSRVNLASLVKNLASGAILSRKSDDVSFHSVASIDSTTPTTVTIEGRSVAAVAGVVDGKLRPYYVGEVPPIVPEDEYFDHDFFHLPGFQPRKFDRSNEAIKQIGIDAVLRSIIGDDL